MDEQVIKSRDKSSLKEIHNDLLIRSLNFHGQQLTSLIKDEPIFRELNLKNVDYHLYQTRCPELRMEDRGYRLDLHRFIASNIKQIFKKNQTICSTTITSAKAADTSEKKEELEPKPNDCIEITNKQPQHLLSASMPPYELFASSVIDREDRLRHVFEILTVSDIIYCRVAALNASGLLLNVCCFAGINLGSHLHQSNIEKSRYMEDLKIKCFCPADELVGASETQAKDKGRLRSYQTGDFVCVVVLEVKRDTQRLLVSMKCNTLLDPESAERKCKSHGIQLGLVSSGLSNLPLTYQKTLQATEQNLQYDKLLETSEGFSNPTSVEVLAEEIGLCNFAGNATLMSNFGPFQRNSYATHLRKRQNANASYRHVAQGVKHFKAGENSEAFQCLNAALRIDEENVEGFVARGALYANNGSLQKAIDDFEAALKIKQTHKNAQKYLEETLMAVAQNYEDDRNFVLARDTYTKLLSRNPDCHVARKKLYPLLVSYGKEMERKRNFEDAVNAYINAMSIDKSNKEAKCLLVSLKMRYKGTFIGQKISQKLDR